LEKGNGFKPGELHHFWKGGVSRQYSLKKFGHLKIKCNRCGSKKYLRLHHVNRIPTDNFIENIEILCLSCHGLEHGKKYTCKFCMKIFNRKGHSGIKFCSYDCYWRSMVGKKIKKIKKNCLFCGKEFLGYVQKKDCSYSCKNKRNKKV